MDTLAEIMKMAVDKSKLFKGYNPLTHGANPPPVAPQGVAPTVPYGSPAGTPPIPHQAAPSAAPAAPRVARPAPAPVQMRKVGADLSFMDEVMKCGASPPPWTPLQDIARETEGLGKSLFEGIKARRGQATAAIAAHPRATLGAGLGIGALALYHRAKRKEAERKLGM